MESNQVSLVLARNDLVIVAKSEERTSNGTETPRSGVSVGSLGANSENVHS